MNDTYTEDVFHWTAGRLNPLPSFHAGLGTFMIYRLSAGKSYNQNGVSWSPLAHIQPMIPLMVPLTLLWADWKTSWGLFQPNWFSDYCSRKCSDYKINKISDMISIQCMGIIRVWHYDMAWEKVIAYCCRRSRSSSTSKYLHCSWS